MPKFKLTILTLLAVLSLGACAAGDSYADRPDRQGRSGHQH
jgi:hypothetical protein